MKELLVEHGKGRNAQITLKVRKTEADSCFAEEQFSDKKTSCFAASYLVAAYLTFLFPAKSTF